jgi:hypothetical protein
MASVQSISRTGWENCKPTRNLFMWDMQALQKAEAHTHYAGTEIIHVL